MGKQQDSKHISLWIPNSLYKECNIYQIRHGIKTRSEYVTKALEFYNAHLSREEASDFINKEFLYRMETMMDSLEDRIGRQMFKLIVESAKICRILLDGLELDMDDFDELHERCIKPVSPPAAYRRLKKLLKKAGLPNISFHDLRHTFATVAVANGVDIKTLSTIIGHVSSKTTMDIYLHTTEEMKQQAAAKINTRFSKNASTAKEVTPNEQEKPTQAKFEPTKGKYRKPGTGCISKINDHLYEGRYSPKGADGKRISKNVYAKTEAECEEKLAELIRKTKAEIATEKAKMKSLDNA